MLNKKLLLRRPEENEMKMLYSLNQSEIPHVNDLSLEEFLSLSKKSIYLKVATLEEKIAGFLMGFDETADYKSLNFLWFKARYPHFFYIDRIVVSRDFRRQRIGRTLYQDVEQVTQSTSGLITTEVNLNPPNPESLKFHLEFGFKEVGRQNTEAGKKTVCLMTKDLKNLGKS